MGTNALSFFRKKWYYIITEGEERTLKKIKNRRADKLHKQRNGI